MSVAFAGLAGCGGKRARVGPPAPDQPSEARAERDAEDRNPFSIGSNPSLDVDAQPSLRGAILETAYSQLGTPYRWGGQDPSTGFDCSGFVQWVFEEHGIQLPRSSRLQSGVGIPIERADLRPGDLLFYSRRRGSKQVGHVGIYVGDGRFIHSPRRGLPIQEDDAFGAYRSATFVAARRMVSDGEDDGPPPAPPLVAEGEGEPTIRHYIVQKGDYIWALAKRFEVSPFELLRVNGLKKNSILRIGQKLLIP